MSPQLQSFGPKMLSFDAIGEAVGHRPVLASVRNPASKPTSSSLLGTSVVSNPKVFVVVNTTSVFLKEMSNDRLAGADLKRAAKILEEEKKCVLEFLDEQGYSIDADCIFENKTKKRILHDLKERINKISQACLADHDALMVWFLGIESDGPNEILFTQDDGLSIDEIYNLFKTKPCIHKFLGKPKLFFFVKVKGVAPSFKRKSAFTVSRIPVDADFWTCLVDLPLNIKSPVISLMTSCVRNTTLDVELDNIMYFVRSRWSHITSRVPITSSTLREDVLLRKRVNPFIF